MKKTLLVGFSPIQSVLPHPLEQKHIVDEKEQTSTESKEFSTFLTICSDDSLNNMISFEHTTTSKSLLLSTNSDVTMALQIFIVAILFSRQMVHSPFLALYTNMV
jgi:hypothetical protein